MLVTLIPPGSVLERLARGDASACGDCIQTYGALVWALARRFTRSAADAEDATQDIFLCLWQSAARFDRRLGSEETFIATLARRRLADGARRLTARHEAAHVPLEDADLSRLPGDGADAGRERVDVDVALRALDTLRPDYRRVLELSFGIGLTQAEISARLELPLGTVKSYMRRGLLAMRAALETTAASTPGTVAIVKRRLARRIGAMAPATAQQQSVEAAPAFGMASRAAASPV